MPPESSAGAGLSPALTALFAAACGALVANIYYAQPLIGLIGPELGLAPSLAGVIVTMTQLGYGAGLLFVVSLADLMENRRLVLLLTAGAVAGAAGVATATSAVAFLLFSFMAGLCSVGAQILIPLAAHLAPEARRGRVLGNIMAGLLTGIMLARPLASAITATIGWRATFWAASVLMLAMWALLWRALPRRQPVAGLTYGGILASTLGLLATIPVLQRRAAYQALLFAAFNLFWTAVPLLLSRDFGFTQRGIAVFALAGAGGALAAPLAGRLADRGLIRLGSGLSMAGTIAAFLLADAAAAWRLALALVAAAVLLDAAVQTNIVLSQRVIYGLRPDARGRLNAAFMTVVFLGGAAGSALGAMTFAWGGWTLTALTGTALGIVALLLFFTELR